MKKVLCMCLALCLMLTNFVGCDKTDNEKDNQNNTENINENIDEGNNALSTPSNNKVNKNTIIATKGYENGIAYVQRYVEGENIHSFIDKKGNILFETTEYCYNMLEPISKNGITILYTNDMVNYVCDIRNGKIITAEELNGTNICSNYEMTEEGYILVEKVETTYNGSIKSYAIFNDKLEEVFPYSEKLHSYLYDNFWNMLRCDEGYIYSNSNLDYGYFDINTGIFGTDINEIPTSVRDNDSDRIWSDVLNNNEDYVNVYERGAFVNGYAAVGFETEGVYYFTIVDKNGDFCFEPIATKGNYIRGSAGEYVVVAWDEHGESYIEVFDTNGKVTEFIVEIENFAQVELNYSENVICIASGLHDFNTKERICEFYSEDGTELF
ncbi:MAG: hypothetical protein IJZ16_13270 [Clostridia bacterium]|nr:hypothetical protein [Clostridia bacterium]